MAVPVTELGYARQNIGHTFWNNMEETPELQWPNSVKVYGKMRRQDSQITSVLRAITLPIMRTGWRIDQGDARPEVAAQIADDLRLPLTGAGDAAPINSRAKGRFSFGDHLRQALLMIQYGHMYFEQVYRVEDDKVRLRKLAPRLPKTITEIMTAADGGLVSIIQAPPPNMTSVQQTTMFPGQIEIPVDRLVAYIHEQEAGDWIGSSLLRPAYKHWLLKDMLMRVQATTIDRQGMGIPIYKGADDEDRESFEAGRDLAMASRSGDNSGGAIPFGADFTLQGVQGQLPEADKVIRYHDEQIARAVLAHFLNLGGQAGTGSWALGSTFADFFVLSLQTLGQQICDVVNQHVIEDLVDLNWGEEEIAPKLVFDEIGSRRDATADAIRTLMDAGLLLPDRSLEEFIRVQYGLPGKDFYAKPTTTTGEPTEKVEDVPDPTTPPPPKPAVVAKASNTRKVEWA